MSSEHMLAVGQDHEWIPVRYDGEVLCYARQAMLEEPLFCELLAALARRKRGDSEGQ